MSPAADVHPSPPQLAAFAHGQLDDDRASTVAEHLAGCASCCGVAANAPADPFLRWLRSARAPLPPDDSVAESPPACEGLPEVFGRYRILRKLGAGGMGTVYLAHDTHLDRRVALKVPHFRLLANASVLERFYREARAAASFDHPNLCPVFDVGCHDGIHYLTMPFIDGRPLADLLVQGQPWPLAQAAALVCKLALALQEAHARGVVHRDLKPANILINQRQEPVITDFGLARLTSRPESHQTTPGTLLGTPAYMAPEQVLGEPEAVAAACDVYALGVVLYQLLTGRLPFQGPATAILGRILSEEPPAVSQLRPGVSPVLEAICRKAMAKQVADRYPSMAKLAAALSEFLQPAPPTGSWLKPSGPPASAPGPAAAGKARRPPWPWVAAAAAIVATLVLSIVLLVPTRSGTIKIELSDPNAQVEVRIDNNVYTLTALGKPLRLRVGEHDLIVRGDDFETVTRKFTVRQGNNPVYTVELVPKKGAAPLDGVGNAPLETADVLALIDRLGGKSRQDFSIPDRPLLEVHLLRSSVQDDDLRWLAGQTHLQVLILGDTRISDAGLAHLQGLTNLQRLDLGTTDITDAGLVHLKGLTRLTRLELYRTTIGDAGLAHLSGLHELRVLGLEGTRVGDAGLAHLKALTRLEALNLGGTNVSDEGLEHLQGLTNIREFHVHATRVTQSAKRRLQETWAAARNQ
jgi:serine/threonine protein kinase